MPFLVDSLILFQKTKPPAEPESEKLIEKYKEKYEKIRSGQLEMRRI